MPSRMLSAKSIDESSTGMQFNQDKGSTTLNQSSELSKEKPKLPSRIKNVDLLEKVGALKTEKLPRQPAKDREEVKKSLVASPLGTPHKPWPSRQLKRFDDPVMNMSNVPLYLQCKGKGDNVHGRALNVGVLDWGLLEKWTHHQKDVGVRDSASSSIESSSFSDFSNQSCTTISSPISQGKRSPVIPYKKSPVSNSPTKICEKDVPKHVKGFHDSSVSSKMLPTRHEDHLDADFCASADLLGRKHDKFIGTDFDMKTSSNQEHLARHSTTSFPMHKIDEATATMVVEDHSCSLMKEAKTIDRDNSLPLTSNMPFYMYCNKGMWDYLQGVGSECLNTGLAEDFEVISNYPQIPHSCPLPLAVLDDESGVASNHPLFGVAPTDASVCINGKQHEINTTTLESRESEAKTKVSRGKQSFVHPSNAGPKRMSKSSSLREGSTEGQHESVPLSYNSRGDQATRNNKSRQSPLRRILDPIMKPKNNLHLTGINAALNNHHSDQLLIDKPPYGLHKPSNPNLNSTRQAREAVFTSNELPNDKGTENEDRHAAQMKQALLQLAWKNGLPLFMFSSCDGEVLAAAITMRSTFNDDDLECVYRIFFVNSSQKKSMFWSNGANNGKKHHLVSNVVGQLNVSLAKLKSYEYGSSPDVRAFVLHDACKSVNSSIASELAAIVVEVTPTAKSDSSLMLNNSNKRGPLSTYSVGNISVPKDEEHLHIHQQNNGREQTSISVIIPSAAHGLSIEGEPSTLIERWTSGACDCGGWDEGCPLSILGNKFQGSQNTDGTRTFQLFTQGASEERRRAFRMVSFKEGLYTVGFQSPISLLQAFAICIAILHDRKPNNHLSQRRSLRAHIYNDQLARTQGGDPMSYVQKHPPLSPFGRA